jgi:hypothetical protein
MAVRILALIRYLLYRMNVILLTGLWMDYANTPSQSRAVSFVLLPVDSFVSVECRRIERFSMVRPADDAPWSSCCPYGCGRWWRWSKDVASSCLFFRSRF